METQLESPTLSGVRAGLSNISLPHRNKPDPKWKRVLNSLYYRTLNRWDAVELRDWCLHSTVAGLESRGLKIDRWDEVVPGAYGPVHCKRYRLSPESRERARELLGITNPSATPADALEGCV